MKLLILLLVIFLTPAHAESFFQAEAGLGMSLTRDLGDGTWYQLGVPHQEHLYSPAFLIGLTGTLYSHDRFDFRYHLDYNFLGTQSASCVCVPDDHYNSKTHKADRAGYIPFNGGGFIHGVSLTIEPGYSLGNSYRIAVEGGGWVFWSVWHEQRLDPQYPGDTDLSHRAVPQFGYVVGASISKGNFTLRYRYYNEPQKWNPYPAIGSGTHALFLTYIF